MHIFQQYYPNVHQEMKKVRYVVGKSGRAVKPGA